MINKMINMKEEHKQLLGIIAVVVIGFILYNLMTTEPVVQSEEGFETNSLESLESRLLDDYNSRLGGKSESELRELAASLQLTLDKYGLHPGSDTQDHSKFALKNDLLEQQKCTVSVAEDRDKFIHKSDMPDQGPSVDMSKYILKSSIPPQQVCPPPKEVDMSKYVLKSSIPPKQDCPACICPKVRVSAGLCQKCPPPPKCPPPQPCEEKMCPQPAPCPVNKQKPCYDVKYIKVPTVVAKTVMVDNNGNIVNNENNNKLGSTLRNYFKSNSNSPKKTEPVGTSVPTRASETIGETVQQSGNSNNAVFENDQDGDKVVMSYNVSQKTPVCMNAELNSAYKKASGSVYGPTF